MRELRVEDALLYLDQVKVEFGDRPNIYNEFLDIMKTFKTQQIDTPGVIRRVSNLFQGNKRLVLGFNTFLPEGYKIELPMDGEGPAVAVYRGQVVTSSTMPPVGGPPPAAAAARPDQQQQQFQGLRPGQPPAPAGGIGGQQQPSLLGQPKAPPAGISEPPPPGAAAAAAAFQRGQQQMQLARSQQPPTMAEINAMRAAAAGPGGLGLAPGGAGAGGFHTRPTGGIQGGAPGVGLDGGLGPASNRLGVHHGPAAAALLAHQMQAQAQVPPQAAQQPLVQAPPQAAAADNQAGVQPPLEFDHAINYVTTIKKRFSTEPETYKKFLEILHTYQKEQRGIKEVLDEVSALFADHPDLLKEFTYFLPDAVQAQAKAQLDQAARESEARKAARSSKEAIMKMGQKMQRPPEPAISRLQQPGGAAMPKGPAAYNNTAGQPPLPLQQQTPFGATQGRLEEREREIARSAHYGIVSFAPAIPPRKSDLNPSQAAAKKGRPTNIPELPLYPNTSESAFFARAKEHLNRKELAPDKPAGSRRHTPYAEFLKCLHLFGSGIVTKEELVQLLKGLFMQGHAPKTGVNAGGGVTNPSVASDAHSLLREFEDILVGRGPYADQETNFKDKSKYGSLRVRDFDYSTCEKPTPSYRTLPSDYPQSLFITNPGESEQDAAVLNSNVVCVGVERSSRKHMTSSPEDYDGIRLRRNAYEEAMFRIEDERYEVDMAIERNAQGMRQIEPFAEEVATLRQNEEKDGQPIGRLQYQLKRYAMNTIPINAIGRIYGENGDEVLQHLARNPLVVLPTVYQRLRQKDSEWRKGKLELRERWNSVYEENYEGGMDYLCYSYRKEIERSFTPHHLLEECRKAKHYSKHPNKVKNHPATRSFVPGFARKCLDADALLFQPHITVQLGKAAETSHHDAFKMISTKIKTSSLYTKSEREAASRIWAEFMLPWFDLPIHWVHDEIRDSFRGKMSPNVVKYAPGQTVRTAFGNGTILSFMEGNPSMGCRYRVKLPFGVASVRPSAIMHSVVQPDGGKMVRRDGVMVKDDNHPGTGEGLFAEKLNKKFELMFATESVYVFMRLYCYLVSLLTDTKEYLKVAPPSEDPAESYFIPKPIKEERKRAPQPRANFPGVISMLGKVVARTVETKDYESYCRRLSKSKVHQMAVLPKLVDKCADALLNVAKEEALLHLSDYCLQREMDPVQLRSLCLGVTPDASYRIQYDSENALVYFSYLPEGETLLTVPQEDDPMQEDDEHADEEDETMKDAVEEENGAEDSKAADHQETNGDEAAPLAKKAKLN